MTGLPAPLGLHQDSDAESGDVTSFGILVHLVVDTDHAAPGQAVHGHLEVINRTNGPITAGPICRADAVRFVVYNARYPERVAMPVSNCDKPFAFPMGDTTIPFSVTMTHEVAGKKRPLPSGWYAVGVVVNGFGIPVPAPLTVIVLSPD